MHFQRALGFLLCVFMALGAIGVNARMRGLEETDPRLYKAQHSFRAPFFIGTGGIPFWEFGGNAMVTDEAVRLTDAQQSRKGWIWNTQAMHSPDWEVTMELMIGSSGRKGADGLAFWYARDYGVEGPVYGSRDRWVGLGVFLDTFDNDQRRDNPSIRAMINDGTRNYDHEHDGIEGSLGAGCGPVDYRNLQQPFKLKVMYVDGVLSVLYDSNLGSGRTGYEEPKWAKCIAIPTSLPTGYHFGLSAATGGLFDQHDVKSFITYAYGVADIGYQNEQDQLQQELSEKHAEQERLLQQHHQDQSYQQQQQQQQHHQQQQQDQQSQHAQQNQADDEAAALRKQLDDLKRELAEKNAQQAQQQAQHAQQQAQQYQQSQQQHQQQAQVHQQAERVQTIDTSRTVLSTSELADLAVTKAKVADLERILLAQVETINHLSLTADSMAKGVVAIQHAVTSLSASQSGSNTMQTQQFSQSVTELKTEVQLAKRATESEGTNIRTAISSLQQHLGPIRSGLEQLTNAFNAWRTQTQQQQQQGAYNAQQYDSDSSSWTSWIIFFIIEIIILGGFGMWMKKRPKRERYMD